MVHMIPDDILRWINCVSAGASIATVIVALWLARRSRAVLHDAHRCRETTIDGYGYAVVCSLSSPDHPWHRSNNFGRPSPTCWEWPRDGLGPGVATGPLDRSKLPRRRHANPFWGPATFTPPGIGNTPTHRIELKKNPDPGP